MIDRRDGVAFSDASEPVHTGRRFATHLKDRLRPLASALPQLSGLPSWARTMGVLKHHGFSPTTVFDIGVGYGTFPLYRAFPNAFYHLIDPARESLAYMQRLSRRLRCALHAVALGDHDCEAALEVRADIQESTLLEEVGPRRVRRIDRVPLRRFDALFAGPIARPALCKIDVQGAELMVLVGHDRAASRHRRAGHRDQHNRHGEGRRRSRKRRALPGRARLRAGRYRRFTPSAARQRHGAARSAVRA
jgi:FkbM family methyltransferase